MDSFLGDGGGQVSYENVSFRVRLLVHHLKTHIDDFAIDLEVVESFLTSGSILLGQELGVAVVERLICLFVDDDNSAHNVEALSLDQFKKVEVIELAGQVSNVKGGESLLLFLFALVLLGRV